MKANFFLENKNDSAIRSYSAQLTAVAASPLFLACAGLPQLFLLICTSDIRYQNPLSALPMSTSNVLPTLLC